ncbi:hypothetical protein BH23PSE1_BH23PSE1_01950 [soil metagenome]
MPVTRTLASAAVALGLTLGGVSAALAQDAPAAPAEAPAGAFSDEQLQSFVTAALEVSGIQQEIAADLMETEDQAAQEALLADANTQMVGAIEGTPGITVDEYIAIADAAEADPDLSERLQGMIIAAQTQ